MNRFDPQEMGRFTPDELEKAWKAYESNRSSKIPMLDEEMPHCNDNCLHCGVAEIMKGARTTSLEQVVRHLRVLAPMAKGRVMFGVSELTIRPDFHKITGQRTGLVTLRLLWLQMGAGFPLLRLLRLLQRRNDSCTGERVRAR